MGTVAVGTELARHYRLRNSFDYGVVRPIKWAGVRREYLLGEKDISSPM